jgi:hypothetical protein
MWFILILLFYFGFHVYFILCSFCYLFCFCSIIYFHFVSFHFVLKCLLHKPKTEAKKLLEAAQSIQIKISEAKTSLLNEQGLEGAKNKLIAALVVCSASKDIRMMYVECLLLMKNYVGAELEMKTIPTEW